MTTKNTSTRYEQGDFVYRKADSRIHEVTMVENPDSDSPTYEIKDVEDGTLDWRSASELRKVDLNGYHIDTVIEEIEKTAKELAAQDAAITYSTDYGAKDKHIIARFNYLSGTAIAVDGKLMREGATNEDLPFDKGNYETTGEGGRVHSTEQEVPVDTVAQEVVSNLDGVSHEVVYDIIEQKYGSSSSPLYIVVSGDTKYWKIRDRHKEGNVKTAQDTIKDLMDLGRDVEGNEGYYYRGGSFYKVTVQEADYDDRDARVRLEENSPFAYKGDKTWVDAEEIHLQKK